MGESSRSSDEPGHDWSMWRFPKIVWCPKWMVFLMENPINMEIGRICDEREFQDPRLKVPTIYKAYFLGLCKRISQQIWPEKWYSTSILGSWNSHSSPPNFHVDRIFHYKPFFSGYHHLYPFMETHHTDESVQSFLLAVTILVMALAMPSGLINDQKRWCNHRVFAVCPI